MTITWRGYVGLTMLVLAILTGSFWFLFSGVCFLGAEMVEQFG